MTLRLIFSVIMSVTVCTVAGTELPAQLEMPQIFEQLPFCDRSFMVLRKCSEESSTQMRDCCSLYKVFKLQGCQCPSCDEQEETQMVEELTSKGRQWMEDLLPLSSLCALQEADVLVGEASLPTEPLSKASLVPPAQGRASVMDIAAFAPQHGRSLAAYWEEEEGRDEVQTDPNTIPLLGAFDDSEGDVEQEEEEEDDVDEAYWTERGDYGAWGDNQGTYGSEENDQDHGPAGSGRWGEEGGWEGEGWPSLRGDNGDTERNKAAKVSNLVAAAQGLVVRRRKGGEVVRGEEDWGSLPAVHRRAGSALELEPFLLNSEILASGEDFPLDTYPPRVTQGAEVVEGDAQRAQQADRDQIPHAQGAQPVMVRRSRTVSLTMELPQIAMSKASDVVKHVVEQLSRGVWGEQRPLSRKLVIDISVEPMGKGAGVAVASLTGHHDDPLFGHSAQGRPSHLTPAADLPPLAAFPAFPFVRRMFGSGEVVVEEGEVDADCQCSWLQPLEAEGAGLRSISSRGRLLLCQFSCRYRTALVVVSVLEAALLACWLCYAVLRCCSRDADDEEHQAGEDGCGIEQPGRHQFVVCAADEEWAQPLLRSKAQQAA